MEIKTFKVFSYCTDFEGEDDIQDKLSEFGEYDTYVRYTAHSKEWLIRHNYSYEDTIENKLIELGAHEGETVLIHLDW